MNSMRKKVEELSLLVSLPVSIIGMILFEQKTVFIGVWIGCMMGLIGFNLIIQMTQNLNPDGQKAEKQGRGGYALRYLVYGIILFISAYKGIPVLSVLAGMMCHKASLLIYSAIGKEDA